MPRVNGRCQILGAKMGLAFSGSGALAPGVQAVTHPATRVLESNSFGEQYFRWLMDSTAI